MTSFKDILYQFDMCARNQLVPITNNFSMFAILKFTILPIVPD